jgi:IstB-like ATP binding protein
MGYSSRSVAACKPGPCATALSKDWLLPPAVECMRRTLVSSDGQGRIGDHFARMRFVVLDELRYLPFAQSGGQLLFHLVSRLHGANLRDRHHKPQLR